MAGEPVKMDVTAEVETVVMDAVAVKPVMMDVGEGNPDKGSTAGDKTEGTAAIDWTMGSVAR